MKLYYKKGSCSLAVRIVINELGLNCEYEAVDLTTKKTTSGADYYEINSKGSVPALVLDDGEVLTENTVIQQYLADVHHAKNLLPTLGNFARYRVLEWLNFATTDLHKGFSPLFNSKIPTSLKEEIFMPVLKAKFDYVNNHLATREYLAGEHFTLPDAYLFVILSWFPHVHLELSGWLNLQNYFEKIKARPAVVKSLAEEAS